MRLGYRYPARLEPRSPAWTRAQLASEATEGLSQLGQHLIGQVEKASHAGGQLGQSLLARLHDNNLYSLLNERAEAFDRRCPLGSTTMTGTGPTHQKNEVVDGAVTSERIDPMTATPPLLRLPGKKV